MIPKVIHYCWFGGNPKPKLAKKCIRSWKKYCPDSEILEWNESNYDLSSAPLYVRQAYERKKWAFVTDYVRLQVVYDHGGIYLDTDVELLRSLDDLLENKAYFGFEDGECIATGLGFGAEKGIQILKEMMEQYHHCPFILPDGTYDLETCTERNTKVFIQHGLQPNGKYQVLDDNVFILPECVLRPYHDWKGTLNIVPETISIHWYNASWQPDSYKKDKESSVNKAKEMRRKEFFHCLPQRVLRKILGNATVDRIKETLKRG